AITAPRGSGTISVNGAAAHLAGSGDLVIIASYSDCEEAEAAAARPVLVYVDGENSIREISAEIAGCV
ncbi:MAG: aspartate 1-decarboxylase, partial [Thermodesulfobacteriota bacterium]